MILSITHMGYIKVYRKLEPKYLFAAEVFSRSVIILGSPESFDNIVTHGPTGSGQVQVEKKLIVKKKKQKEEWFC